MGKPRKTSKTKKFNYNKNRRRAWKNSKKQPIVQCDQMKQAWDSKKSVKQNLADMGLAYDANKTMGIPKQKAKKLGIEGVDSVDLKKVNPSKVEVLEELERDASRPENKKLKLSEPEVKFCIYMMEKYNEDYKAMARDRKNYYQDTPKQIRRRITTFKQNVPEQYDAYLKSKEQKMDTT